MFTATPNRVRQYISDVTNEQIGLCAKYFDASGKSFYQVTSESDQFDENGDIAAYKVTYDENGFHCTCPSGQRAFSNVKHPSGVCKHVRFAMACEQEVRRAMAGLMPADLPYEEMHTATDIFEVEEEVKPARKPREHYITSCGKEVSDEEYDRIVNAPIKPIDYRAKAPTRKAFSLYR
jgi:hypothetical protein